MNKQLVQKYNVPGPRYTSYPPVPAWSAEPSSPDELISKVKESFSFTNQKRGISIYIHLPFCESLCTYCACNTRITVNHAVEIPYIKALLAEWKLYLETFNETPEIAEIHLGGGTPTFFQPENLKILLDGILTTSVIREDVEMGFEGHPNNTTAEHMQVLYDLGFRRVSFGIQDFDPIVQEKIHRVQSFEQVNKVVNEARSIGYQSINFDLIYGLPFQTVNSIELTMNYVKQLNPDRIALYSYAHVPWVKTAHRSFSECDLPQGEYKRALYELGKEKLTQNGYQEIGLDHFSLPTDDLFIASQEGRLNRNFMGYTTSQSELCIGLGVSSIGDTGSAYIQNIKTVEAYQERVSKGQFPFLKGHTLTRKELIARRYITDLMCRFNTKIEEDIKEILSNDAKSNLQEMENDGLIKQSDKRIIITEKGQPFVRNACMAFDIHLKQKSPSKEKYSTVV
ncbi:MAG: oxygen-independent coproporphyrinogen III oxidase [Reichenbachiella sp.]